ncbi:MAG: transporter substrate-binding domain-containing protein [Desulfobacterales bacterium]|nr:transporter substrate-binding domain-containing protein [Desulfobacterales bacterium]
MKKQFFITALLLLIMAITTSTVFAGGTVSAGTVNWPPYYGKELQGGGYMTEITREAFKRTGWDYQVEFMNWNRAVNLCEKGKLDMVQGAYFSDERAKKFHVTEEYASVDVVFFSSKDAGIGYSKLEDLKDYKIGLIRGWAYPDAITQSGFLTTEITETPVSNIKKLLKGRVDLIIGAKIAVMDIVNREMPGNTDQLVALAPPIQKNSLHNLVSLKKENGQEIADAFNKGLQLIKEDGTYEKILKRYGF